MVKSPPGITDRSAGEHSASIWLTPSEYDRDPIARSAVRSTYSLRSRITTLNYADVVDVVPRSPGAYTSRHMAVLDLATRTVDAR